jgi:hypothetical protein
MVGNTVPSVAGFRSDGIIHPNQYFERPNTDSQLRRRPRSNSFWRTRPFNFARLSRD